MQDNGGEVSAGGGGELAGRYTVAAVGVSAFGNEVSHSVRVGWFGLKHMQ